jgi:hypothetical protein
VGFDDDVATVATDAEMLRLAIRHAGSRELAEDSIQETVRALGERKSPDAIGNLRGFFYVALIHEIDHQLARPSAFPVGGPDDIWGHHQDLSSEPGSPLAGVEGDAHLRVLAKTVLAGLEREGARHGPSALIPARSGDPDLYRSAIAWSAKVIFALLLEGCVTTMDWNAILKAACPQWCDEPGLARDARDQRLSRARRDVQLLLRSVLPREQLAS